MSCHCGCIDRWGRDLIHRMVMKPKLDEVRKDISGPQKVSIGIEIALINFQGQATTETPKERPFEQNILDKLPNSHHS